MGDTFSWNGGSGAFSDPSKWIDLTNPGETGIKAPGSLDTADFAIGGSVSGTGTITEATIESTLTVAAAIAATEIINSGSIILNNGTLDTSGELRTTGAISVGSDGTIQAAATVASGAAVEIDTGGSIGLSGPTAALNTTEGGVVVGATSSGTLAFSNQATATLNSTDGSWASVVLGQSAGASGVMTVNGATVTTNTGGFNIGLAGNGSLALSGGAYVSVDSGNGTSASIILGRSAGATGTITLTGANTTLTTDGGVNVGDTGSGSIDVSGGAGFSATSTSPSLGAAIALGGPHAGKGTLTVSGTHSAVTVNAGGIEIGYNGTGYASVSNSASLIVTDATLGIDIGSASGGVGTLIATGLDSTISDAAGIQVGDSGTGIFTVAASADVSIAADLQIGVQSGSTGTVTINAGTVSADTGAVVVGISGAGTVTVTSDGTLESGAGFVGADDGGTGTVEINAGTWSIDDLLDIGVVQGGTGTVTVTGDASSLEVAGTVTVGDGDTGTLEVKDAAFATAGALVVAAQSTSGDDSNPSMVLADGSGSVLVVDGDGTIDSATPTANNDAGYPNGGCGEWAYTDSGTGQVKASDGGYIAFGGMVTLQASPTIDTPALVVESGGGIEVGGASGLLSDTLNIDDDGVILGYGTIEVGDQSGSVFTNGTVLDNGVIDANTGTLVLEGDLTGGGSVQIEENATFELNGTADDTDTITFNGAAETTLLLDDATQFSASVANFQEGDTIDLAGITGIAAPGTASVKYGDGELTLRTVGSIPIADADPYPTFTLRPDGNGGTDIETVSLPTLLGIAFATYQYNPDTEPVPPVVNDYSCALISAPDRGFQGFAYIDADNSADCDKNIVVAFRGTYLDDWAAAIKNILADSSFLAGSPNALLQQYVKDAVAFLQQVQSWAAANYPSASITLTGHSLGGALAQLLGEASSYGTAAFNAPGTAQVYAALGSELAPIANSGDGGTNINYRVSGDQVSLAGTPLGQTLTLSSPYTSSDDTIQNVIGHVLDNHLEGAFANLENASAYTSGLTGPDYVSAIQGALQSPLGASVVVHVVVSAGVAYALDPAAGTTFTFTEDTGSPAITSVDLPSEPGVGTYDLAWRIDGTWSSFEQVSPASVVTLPVGVSGVEFESLDSSGNPVVIPDGLLFIDSFSSSGTVSGTIVASGAQAVGEPSTTPASLTVAEDSAATAIGIAAPTDTAFPSADLAITVTGLPTDGTIHLSDGVTPVSVNEALSVTQLTGLTFAPTTGLSDEDSVFTYSVTDPDWATAGGSAATDIACFLIGTRIATPDGDIPVEHLWPGMSVLTASGALRTIRWIGHRRIELRRHPDVSRVQPIRIRAGAFASGRPSRELYLSPDHAVFHDGRLIPIRLLINRATIAQDTVIRSADYFHVELDGHDILLAEQLPAESYLDTGNRAMFANAPEPLILHADFDADQQHRREIGSCAPLTTDPGTVEPIWRDLADRAVQLGYDLARPETTTDPALRLLAGGRVLFPAFCGGGHYRFILPANADGVRLVSRATRPCVLRPWIEDRRCLGVMVKRLRLGDRAIALDNPSLGKGWWSFEGRGEESWRWTDGDAFVPLAPAAPALLDIETGGTLRYPLQATPHLSENVTSETGRRTTGPYFPSGYPTGISAKVNTSAGRSRIARTSCS